MAYIVKINMAYTDKARMDMVYIDMAYIVMAHVVTAHIVMTLYSYGPSDRRPKKTLARMHVCIVDTHGIH